MNSLSFAPYLPLSVILSLTIAVCVVSLLRIRHAPYATFFRLLAVMCGSFYLLNPQWQKITGNEVPDIAVIIEDQSRSTSFGSRQEIITENAERLESRLVEMGLEIRKLSFGSVTESNLASVLQEGLADIPRRRLSAITVLTDGRIEGNLALAGRGIDVPVHAIVTGNPDTERDRMIEVVNAPRFGIVGETVELVFKITSPGEEGEPILATLMVDGDAYSAEELIVGQEVKVSVPMTSPGDRLIELSIPAASGELTLLNNRSVTALTAIRDRLRVLLVSGQPHAGERVWRNLLKSDPAVDLVHFTILKPAGKAAIAREEELNLIEFPHVELFLQKLPEFDILIFDRYVYREVLQSFEFERIARYVENGGAVLIAAGPEFTGNQSIARRPNLAYILPALPTGNVTEAAFLPQRSADGLKHPVTAELEASQEWGRWYRQVSARVRDGHVLMTGKDDQPLLVVDRIEKGRIAILLSDHIWLWARNFDGGGPHRELLRRLVHWLMQEPELEEEALSAKIAPDGTMTILRRSLGDDVPPVTVIAPEGQEQTVAMKYDAPGLFSASVMTEQQGLYRLMSSSPEGKTLFAVTASGEEQIAEIGKVTTTRELIALLTEMTGGGNYALRSLNDNLPALRRTTTENSAAGPNWAGFPKRQSLEIEEISIQSIFSAMVGLVLIAGLLVLAWLIEGQPWRKKS